MLDVTLGRHLFIERVRHDAFARMSTNLLVDVRLRTARPCSLCSHRASDEWHGAPRVVVSTLPEGAMLTT